MNYEEHPLCFSCQDDTLYGILTMPQQPSSRAVLIVVGGPQYRAGSHRQFVLLARDFASHGYPVLRFDYRGMGDSEGESRNFEQIGDDLRAAIDQLFEAAPSVREVVIWGLCDGASAAMFYVHQDERVSGLVLVNPWARTEEGEAKARLKHYYHGRLLDSDLWKKVACGTFDYSAAARSLWTAVGRAYGKFPAANERCSAQSLPDRLHDALARFKGASLLIMSANDLTAQEFADLVQQSEKWRELISRPQVQRYELIGANHTFSRREWREELLARTLRWMDELVFNAGFTGTTAGELANA